MSKKANHNSIIFLTTLSVYLGLVLVGGAAAPVLAHSAMTRNFDIKNEIVFEDDLDKKPDEDEKALDVYVLTLRNLFSLAKDFSAKESKNLRNNKYEFDCALTHAFDSAYNISCGGGSGLFWSGFVPPMEEISNVFPHQKEKDKEQVKFNLILSGEEFYLKTILTQEFKEQAEIYQNYYDTALSIKKLKQTDNPQIVIYQNTEITFENNQVFIVTRLPRGSIDALLAEKDAQ